MSVRNLILPGIAVSIVLSLAATSFAERDEKIFNGKDFKGWTKKGGEATYAVEDGGVIVGRSAPNTPNTFLTTDKEYGDFILELDFKIDEGDFNSGVQIRSHSDEKHNNGRVYGYQVEIDPLPRAYSGGIYFEGGSPQRKAGWLQNLDGKDEARKAFKHGDWNHFKVVAKGPHIQTWINGVPAADYKDEDKEAFIPKGFIALQVHGVGPETKTKEVRWKNLKLTVLD